MKTNIFLVGTFLLSCSLGWPLKAQEPDVPQARRKALEAERDKLAQRLGEIDTALSKLKPAVKPGEPVVIEGFLGISADFSVCAAWDVDSLAFMELVTNKRLPAPPWEPDWGLPRDVLFGVNFVAIHANTPPIKFTKGRDLPRNPTVKIFSRKTLEMERNFRGPITVECVAGGNVLALLIDYDGDQGKRLVLHDINAKKQIAHIGLDQNYVYSLAAAGKYLAFQGRHFSGKNRDGQVTILDAETGKVTAAVTTTLAEMMLPRRLPLAISADGARLAWPTMTWQSFMTSRLRRCCTGWKGTSTPWRHDVFSRRRFPRYLGQGQDGSLLEHGDRKVRAHDQEPARGDLVNCPCSRRQTHPDRVGRRPHSRRRAWRDSQLRSEMKCFPEAYGVVA